MSPGRVARERRELKRQLEAAYHYVATLNDMIASNPSHPLIGQRDLALEFAKGTEFAIGEHRALYDNNEITPVMSSSESQELRAAVAAEKT